MALSSPRLGSNPITPYPAFWVRGNGQLGLNQRVNELRRTSMMGSREGSWGGNVHPRETMDVAAALPPPPPVITTVKASDFLKEQLLRVPALAPKHRPGGGRSSWIPERAPSPALRFHRFVEDFGTGSSERSCMQRPSEAAVVNMVKSRVQKKYDGRIHSYPHKKNGPYTCPKCKGVFATSQIFASHVSSVHYKFESRSEKKKRLMARYFKRKHTVQWVNGELSIIWGVNKNSGNAPPPPPTPPPPPPTPPHPQVRVFAKTECVEESAPPPPLFGKPITSNIVFGKQILPSSGFGMSIPPPVVFGNPISTPSVVVGKPVSPGLGFGNAVPAPPGFGNALPPPPGFGNAVPPRGFEKPVSPPPGFEKVYSVPGSSNPFGVQNVTVAAPRGVQIKLEIQ